MGRYAFEADFAMDEAALRSGVLDLAPERNVVLRDFEGLSGHLHAYKIDIANVDAEEVRGAGLPAATGVLVNLDACQF